MTVSVVPALIDALKATATTALPNCLVVDGPGNTDDARQNVLFIGIDDPNQLDQAQAADVQQDWAGIGSTAPRDETGDITCAALSWNGDADQKAARDAAYATVAAVKALTGRALPAGIPELLWTLLGARSTLTQDQDDKGALALVVFTIHFRARLA